MMTIMHFIYIVLAKHRAQRAFQIKQNTILYHREQYNDGILTIKHENIKTIL